VCLSDNNDQWWVLLNTANNNWVTKRQIILNMKDFILLNIYVECFWLRSLSGTNRFDVKCISEYSYTCTDTVIGLQHEALCSVLVHDDGMFLKYRAKSQNKWSSQITRFTDGRIHEHTIPLRCTMLRYIVLHFISHTFVILYASVHIAFRRISIILLGLFPPTGLKNNCQGASYKQHPL